MGFLKLIKTISFVLCGAPLNPKVMTRLEKLEKRKKKPKRNIFLAIFTDPFYIKYDRKKVIKDAMKRHKRCVNQRIYMRVNSIMPALKKG